MKIVSCTPSTTDILKLLGLESSIVGADDLSCQFLSNPKVATLGPIDNINVQHISQLNPDLVIFSDNIPGSEAVLVNLRQEELPVLVLQTERFDDLLSDIFTIGAECKVEDIARDLIVRLDKNIKSLERLVQSKDEPIKAYFEWWPNPFVTIGSESWISDMLKKSGAVNVFDNIPNPSFIADEDKIVERDPEVIFICWSGQGDETTDMDPDAIFSRKLWKDVPAIKKKQIHFLPESLFAFPGPNMIEGLAYMIDLVTIAISEK